MSTNQNIETVTSSGDRAKVFLAVAAVVAGIVAYYVLSRQPGYVRVGVMLAGIAAGIVIGWFSAPGQRLLAFAKDSWTETRRVVWPERKETIQMTLIVFAFVVVTAIFLWVVDKGLEFALYDLILGWKK